MLDLRLRSRNKFRDSIEIFKFEREVLNSSLKKNILRLEIFKFERKVLNSRLKKNILRLNEQIQIRDFRLNLRIQEDSTENFKLKSKIEDQEHD